MKSKIKIIDKVPLISEDEIKSYMDFDGLFQQHQTIKTGRTNLYKNSLTTIAIIIGIVTGLYFLTNRAHVDDNNKQGGITVSNILENKKEIEIPKKELALNVTNEVIVTPPIEPNDKEEKSNEHKIIEKEEQHLLQSKEVTLDDEQEINYEYVEASPVEGLPYLYAYFNRSLTYPEGLKKDSIEGVVLISFSVLRDSTLSNLIIVQSLGEQFDKEAIRVMKGMPKWIPATVNNVPVDSKLSIPLTFNIKK